MRNVNPDDLDRLAKLLDGKGGVTEKLTEAFTHASSLGVSGKLAALKPMQTWVTETPPDIRKRATAARADTLFERGHRETYSDWLIRVEAHYLAKVPGLKEIGEKNLASLLKTGGEIAGFAHVTTRTTFVASSLMNVSLRNSWNSRSLRTAIESEWWTRARRSSAMKWVGRGLNRLPKGTPASLSAPGSWLPSRLGGLFANNRLYQISTRIPFTTAWRNALLGDAYDVGRRIPVVRSPFTSRAINFAVGSDSLAASYGGLTHSGQAVARAGNANLMRVFQNARSFQAVKNGIGIGEAASPMLTGLKTAGKAGGFLRFAGVGASAAATGLSIANVAAQGNPVDAFKEKGAGYVADVAEAGFNASMTAAMVAPNPVTIGLAVGTGLVYGGAKVVEHWDGIKEGAGKATDWVGDKVSKVTSSVTNGAKSLAKKANPMNWF